MKNNEKNNGVFLIVILFIGAALVFMFPRIREYMDKVTAPKLEDEKEEETITKREVTEEMFEVIHFPLMRNSAYSSFTYYTLDTFKISDMSNGDILLNAFLDLIEDNIVDSGTYGECTNTHKEFKSTYINLKVSDMIGKNTKYTLEDFYVPSDSKSSYPGTWHYNGYTYYYGGLCSEVDTSVKYYDLEKMIDANYDGDDIVINYYVAFAKVEGDNYTIYSDPKMENAITSGTGDVKSVFNRLDTSKIRKYQYRFKNTLCTYSEYCLYEGKWI